MKSDIYLVQSWQSFIRNQSKTQCPESSWSQAAPEAEVWPRQLVHRTRDHSREGSLEETKICWVPLCILSAVMLVTSFSPHLHVLQVEIIFRILSGRGSPGRFRMYKAFYSLSSTMFQPFSSPRMNNCKLAFSQEEFRMPVTFEKLGAVLWTIL